jgi:hypothetical protein
MKVAPTSAACSTSSGVRTVPAPTARSGNRATRRLRDSSASGESKVTSIAVKPALAAADATASMCLGGQPRRIPIAGKRASAESSGSISASDACEASITNTRTHGVMADARDAAGVTTEFSWRRRRKRTESVLQAASLAHHRQVQMHSNAVATDANGRSARAPLPGWRFKMLSVHRPTSQSSPS